MWESSPLELGNTSERIAVTAEATPVQTPSSEKSQLVDGRQLNDITLKGRDLFGYMRLIPGVIDTANRDVTSPNGFGNITINGNTSAKNFTVDGMTDVDTGSNGTIHYEPNIDAVQELKVLTSNYQAEFGRNNTVNTGITWDANGNVTMLPRRAVSTGLFRRESWLSARGLSFSPRRRAAIAWSTYRSSASSKCRSDSRCWLRDVKAFECGRG